MKKGWHTYMDTTVDSNDYKSAEAGKWATTNSLGSDAFILWADLKSKSIHGYWRLIEGTIKEGTDILVL